MCFYVWVSELSHWEKDAHTKRNETKRYGIVIVVKENLYSQNTIMVFYIETLSGTQTHTPPLSLFLTRAGLRANNKHGDIGGTGKRERKNTRRKRNGENWMEQTKRQTQK